MALSLEGGRHGGWSASVSLGVGGGDQKPLSLISIMFQASVQPHELEKRVDALLYLSLQIVPIAGDKMPE